MFGLAYRQLRFDLGRSVLSCVGIGAVFAVILILQGFRSGFYQQLGSVAQERGAELIAAQAGVSNMVGARSVIPQMARASVEAVEGVHLAHPMTALPMIHEKGGRKTAVFLVVVDDSGGPRRLISGRALKGNKEVVIDRSLAQMYGFTPGDELLIAGYAFRIVGIAKPTSALFTSFAFTNYDSLIDFYFETKLADDISAFPLLSYLLIDLDPGANPKDVATRIERAVPEVDVFEPGALAENDKQLGRTMLGPILVILIAVAYVVGLLVVALFMYSAAESRRKDLGVLKALGFSNRAILVSVIAETSMLVMLAVPIGMTIAYATARSIEAAAPLYLIPITPLAPLVGAMSAIALFALLGALAPLRLIRSVEPAEVFQ